MKKIFLFVLLVLNCLVPFSQTSKIDSLENLLHQHIEKDTSRVNLLNNFADLSLKIDPKKSIAYAEEAYELAGILNFKKGKAESLYYLGLTSFIGNKYEKSLDYFQKSIDNYEALGNKKKIALCLKFFGIIHEHQGNYPLSLENYNNAIEINEEIGNKQGKANCLNNIAIVYYVQGNYPLALEYYQKSLSINEEEDSKMQVANCLNNIATIYSEQGDYTSAFPYYQKSYKISKEISYKKGEAWGLNNLGELCRKQDNFKQALTYYHESIKINEEIGDEKEVARSMNNIGRIYFSQGKNTLAFDFYQKALKKSEQVNDRLQILNSYANLGAYYLGASNLKKALKYTQESFTIAKELENLNQQKRIHLQLSEIYTATKNYKIALENYILYKELNDRVFNEKNIKELSRLEYQYEFDKEKQAIELDQQKKGAITAEKTKHQHILNMVFIFGFVLMLSLIIVILRSSIQKRKANTILRLQKKQIEKTNEALTLQKEEIQKFAFELEKANETKDKFFSIIAHDLKSPFNALLGFSDFLLKNHTTIDEEERGSFIKIINESSVKTYKFLEDLLTWARTQTGKIKFTTELINLSALITETSSLLEESACNKGIKLLLSDEKDLSVEADKNMLETVIRNLLSNAIKFTHKGGVIEVKSQTVTDQKNQKFAEISVKDNGVGIPLEIQSKLFKITENVSTKGTEDETGTGLGLILCKEFVDKHNGKIWVESNVDKGSLFVFRIPMLS
ncbi:tetratricopeptide repeat-containing sensor histidine kinase [Ancylomarina sp. 16SWW S1-10-2]|uniref:tetratricopeptide repeat-containing sensor histidine kinase n=1 Tax=Ancylomarina sp. 16SWW S1-10-2 TaxID=2499681 RepID=UPI0012AD33F9|nr:tetratricopeptide repeat-containing sensor histidine kinase [Ancylomarina sp. 16SWW S1-10-2]MRT92253.1 sensor histidine kinase [Ancylomarina sp. 16SWW S1-10-2]